MGGRFSKRAVKFLKKLDGMDDDYRIVIPWDRFKEEAAVESRGMVAFKGERIELPMEERFMPSLEGLRWHRERWGIG